MPIPPPPDTTPPYDSPRDLRPPVDITTVPRGGINVVEQVGRRPLIDTPQAIARRAKYAQNKVVKAEKRDGIRKGWK